MMRKLLVPAVFLALAGSVYAHPGGLDASGCHNDRKNGGRHCHTPKADAPAPRPAPVRAISAPPTSNTKTIDVRVTIVQKILLKLDFDVEDSAGVVGTKTRDAVRLIERRNGLPETGIIDDRLVELLIEELARKDCAKETASPS
jgi:hypothetical protein